MADFPTYTAADLAAMSARPQAGYQTVIVTTALAQAMLLFKIATCLKAWPDDPVDQELAKMAVLSYADYIVLSQPYQQVAASPLNSETLGSYSYSKSVASAAKGEATGVMWFDLAVLRLGICDFGDGVPEFGGIEVFENDGLFTQGHFEGTVSLLSPADRTLLQQLMDPTILSRN